MDKKRTADVTIRIATLVGAFVIVAGALIIMGNTYKNQVKGVTAGVQKITEVGGPVNVFAEKDVKTLIRNLKDFITANPDARNLELIQNSLEILQK